MSLFSSALSPHSALPLRTAVPYLRVAAPLVASESVAVTTSKAALGVVSTPITWSSLYTLVTTGCGLRGELGGTLEGLAYLVVMGFALASLYTRAATGGLSLRAAELQSVKAEMAALEAAGASEARKRASTRKVAELAGGSALDLLGAAETLSLVSAALVLFVFGFQLVAHGSLPSAVPDGGTCWS